MNITEIEILVEKYYDGKTSLKDERILREFFSGDSVPAYLEYMKKQFTFFENQRGIRLEDSKFDENIFDTPVERGKILIFRMRKPLIYTVYGVAATLLIAIAINYFNFMSVDDPPSISQSTIVDPEEAYRETRQALILISTYVDEAMAECKDISKFDEYRKMIFSN